MANIWYIFGLQIAVLNYTVYSARLQSTSAGRVQVWFKNRRAKLRKIEETQRQHSTSWRVGGSWCCTPTSSTSPSTWQGTSLFPAAAVSGDVTARPWPAPMTSSCHVTSSDVSTYCMCGTTTTLAAVERPDCDCKPIQSSFSHHHYNHHYHLQHQQQQHFLQAPIQANCCTVDEASTQCSGCGSYF